MALASNTFYRIHFNGIWDILTDDSTTSAEIMEKNEVFFVCWQDRITTGGYQEYYYLCLTKNGPRVLWYSTALNYKYQIRKL